MRSAFNRPRRRCFNSPNPTFEVLSAKKEEVPPCPFSNRFLVRRHPRTSHFWRGHFFGDRPVSNPSEMMTLSRQKKDRKNEQKIVGRFCCSWRGVPGWRQRIFSRLSIVHGGQEPRGWGFRTYHDSYCFFCIHDKKGRFSRCSRAITLSPH